MERLQGLSPGAGTAPRRGAFPAFVWCELAADTESAGYTGGTNRFAGDPYPFFFGVLVADPPFAELLLINNTLKYGLSYLNN